MRNSNSNSNDSDNTVVIVIIIVIVLITTIMMFMCEFCSQIDRKKHVRIPKAGESPCSQRGR